MNKINDSIHLCIFVTSKCNLNCRYCFLSKNKANIEIDKLIENSFLDPEFYFNKFKEYAPNNYQNLDALTLWGGEPLLETARAIPLIDRFIKELPKFNRIKFSSNFAHDNIYNSFVELINLFKQYPNRKFIIQSQISIDGPEEINDSGRGKNTTKRIIENYQFLINNLVVPENVTIAFSIKPTLDIVTLDYFKTKQDIINYYKFFEHYFLEPIRSKPIKNMMLKHEPIPNLATPAEYTKEDGIKFYNILKMMTEIEKENLINPIFKYYTKITLYKHNLEIPSTCSYSTRGGFCGAGRSEICLLPTWQACGCHRNYTEFFENYNKNFEEGIHKESSIIMERGRTEFVKNFLIFNNPQELFNFHNKINRFYEQKNPILISQAVVQLRNLAFCGQVDEKYKNVDECVKDLNKVYILKGTCLASNCITTGAYFLTNLGDYKLFFNGAIDILTEGE